MIPLLVSLGMSIVSGFMLIALLWPDRSVRNFPLKIFLSVGLGLGTSSALFFVLLITVGISRTTVLNTDVGLLLALFAAYLVQLRRKQAVGSPMSADTAFHGYWATPRAIAVVSFAIALASAIVAFKRIILSNPHGGWDAWAIWNFHARFLFRDPVNWRTIFVQALSWSHSEYPLLLPGIIARSWEYVGSDIPIGPALISACFIFATVGLLLSSLARLRSATQGLMAATILLCTPLFITNGANEYADVPLSFFFLATLVSLCLRDIGRDQSNSAIHLSLTGITAGFAAWTKNEGIMFLTVLLATHLAISAKRDLRRYARDVRAIGAGLLPVIALTVYFKFKFAPTNQIVGQQHDRILHDLLDPTRYATITDYIANIVLKFGDWSVGPIPLLGFYYLFASTRRMTESTRLTFKLLMVTLSITGLGYFFVYVVSPYDLKWHLSTSLTRLLLQLWPSTLFLFFLAVRTPEELLANARGSSKQNRVTIETLNVQETLGNS